MARRFVVLAFFLVILSSCSWDNSFGKVVYGNYLYGKGEFGKATMVYLNVLEESVQKEYLQYNLANVYLAYGEVESAMQKFLKAASTSNGDLLFRIHYNIGNICYQRGDYEAAITEYIHALENKSHDRNAKYNLELALRQLRNAQSNISPHTTPKVENSSSLKEQASRMLDYIQNKEHMIWRFESDSAPSTNTRDW